jgi:hypothetical protein
VNAHDLAVAKGIVNKAIRKFINDGPPPNGWKWLRPIAQVDLWPAIAYDSSPTPSFYVTAAINPTINGTLLTGTTLLTLTSPGLPNPATSATVTGTPAFYQSMELRTIYLNGNPPPSTPGFFVPNQPTPLKVTALTRSGSTATATVIAAHGLTAGAQVSIYGANASAYNGVHTVLASGLTTTQFQYTVVGTPTTPDPSTAIFEIAASYAIGTPFTVLMYVSPTQIVVDGNAAAGFPTNIPFSFASTGDYTLPANFGGQYVGGISYIANTRDDPAVDR